jgi:hypothetical protein
VPSFPEESALKIFTELLGPLVLSRGWEGGQANIFTPGPSAHALHPIPWAFQTPFLHAGWPLKAAGSPLLHTARGHQS